MREILRTFRHPKPSLRNAIKSDSTSETMVKLNDPETGKCAYLITFDGKVSIGVDMRTFPFDFADINIEISTDAAGQSSGEARPKLICEKIAKSLTAVEWSVAGSPPAPDVMQSVDPRIAIKTETESYELDFTVATANITLLRQPSYYFYKVLLILYILLVMAFTSFLYDDDELGLKMDVIYNSFLASVAFLFVASQTLPALPYLTAMDKVKQTMCLFIHRVTYMNLTSFFFCCRTCRSFYRISSFNLFWPSLRLPFSRDFIQNQPKASGCMGLAA